MAYVQSLSLHLPAQPDKKKISFTDCSEGHTEAERIIAAKLSTLVHDEELYQELNLMKINFDVEIKRNKIQIKSIYLVRDTGHVVKHTFKHVFLSDGKSDTTTQKKGGVVSMPANDRTYNLIYKSSMSMFILAFIFFAISAGTNIVPLEVSIFGTAMSLVVTLATVGLDFLFRRNFE
ncbi:hypothetical protein [Paenibacillus apiarius]|uniref:hypothetical protein n=1 Tax=Paenibacillus apiarius TaxID=46240 RepID=UPI003B3A71E2